VDIRTIQNGNILRLRQSSITFRLELLHFVNGLHSYLMTTVLHAEKIRVERELNAAKDASAMVRVHEASMGIVRDRCFLNEGVYLFNIIF
jgi:hypothetical protein